MYVDYRLVSGGFLTTTCSTFLPVCPYQPLALARNSKWIDTIAIVGGQALPGQILVMIEDSIPRRTLNHAYLPLLLYYLLY